MLVTYLFVKKIALSYNMHMESLKKYRIWYILGLVPLVLLLIYNLLLSFKGTTLFLLTFLTLFSFKTSGVLIENISGASPHQSNWLACYAEKNYWSKYENQSIFAYEIDKNDPEYEKKIENLKNDVISKTSTLGRNNVIDLSDKVIYTYHQYFIPLDQAEKYEAYPSTLRKEWDDQKAYLNYGYKIIPVETYCNYLLQ